MNKTLYIKKDDAVIWKEAKKLIDFKTDNTLSDILTCYLRDKVIPELRNKPMDI